MKLFPFFLVEFWKRGGMFVFSEINASLVEIKEKLQKKAKYEKQLEDYGRELDTIEERLSHVRAQFELEKEDVEKLEHMTLTNLFVSLSGKKEEKLSKEQQEMIAAQHKLEEAEKTKKEIEEAILGLDNKLSSLNHVVEAYQDILLKKETMIKSSESPIAEKIFELSEQEGSLKAYILELDEARAAGEHVDLALVDAIHSLEKAENWGTWDMFGGGTITGLIKHDHIDQAEAYLHKAQTSMRHFQKELLDVHETVSLEVDISGMLKFADFFFDGFITDYMVQGKIEDSLSQASNQHEKVIDILRNLKEQLAEKERELEKIQSKKREIVEGVK